MTIDSEAMRIAESLTKAQREALTTRAVREGPWGTEHRRWATYPQSNTHRVLMRLPSPTTDQVQGGAG